MSEKMKNTLIIILLCCTSCIEVKDVYVEAEVLSINENISEGRLIGAILASSSGYVNNDVNKVGVTFEIQGQRFFYDLKLLHSELAYYRNQKHLTLGIRIERIDMDKIHIWLGNRKVYMKLVERLPVSF